MNKNLQSEFTKIFGNYNLKNDGIICCCVFESEFVIAVKSLAED